MIVRLILRIIRFFFSGMDTDFSSWVALITIPTLHFCFRFRKEKKKSGLQHASV